MINIGDKVKFHITKNTGEKLEVEGIVNGRKKAFGNYEYVVNEWKGTQAVNIRKATKIK